MILTRSIKLRNIIFISLILLLSACGKEDKINSGITISADGTLYENKVFSFSVVKPTGWFAQDIKDLIITQKKGGELAAGNDKNMKAIMVASMNSSLPLFGFYKLAPGTPAKSNPNISGVAERIEGLPGIKTGCDYLFHVKNLMTQSQVNIIFEDKCQSKIINGKEFGYYDASASFGNIKIKQRYLSCIQAQHAIAIVQTSFNEESLEILDGVVNSIQVECDG